MDQEQKIVKMLLQAMDTPAINTLSGTGASCSHLAVAKGNTSLIEDVLWCLWRRGGWAASGEHLAMANHVGQSVADVAFRSQASYAGHLIRDWWAPYYTEKPPDDERGYAWRRRRS